MFATNPHRDVWFDVSIPANHGALIGNAVPLEPFVNAVAVLVTAGPGVAAPVTVTFEVTGEDPLVMGSPNAAGWTQVVTTEICGTPGSTTLEIEIDPAAEPYLTEGQQLTRNFLPCPALFARAVVDVIDPNITVHFYGHARRVLEG